MKGFFSDPRAMQMAGFAILGGKDGAQAMSDAMMQTAVLKQQELQTAELERKQRMQAQLPTIMESLDWSNPDKVAAQLMGAGMEPAQVASLIKARGDVAQQGREAQSQQKMLELFGLAPQANEAGPQPGVGMQQGGGIPAEPGVGGSPPAEALYKYGLATGNKELETYGKFLLDKQQKMDDRNFQEAKEDEKRTYDEQQKLKERSVPGFEFTGENIPSDEDAKKMKNFRSSYTVLTKGVDKIEALYNQYGTEILPGNGKKQMQQAIKQFQLGLKTLEELGALQGPDIEILDQMLPNPTELAAGFTRGVDYNAAYADAREYLADKIKSQAEARGYRPTFITPRKSPNQAAKQGAAQPQNVMPKTIQLEKNIDDMSAQELENILKSLG